MVLAQAPSRRRGQEAKPASPAPASTSTAATTSSPAPAPNAAAGEEAHQDDRGGHQGARGGWQKGGQNQGRQEGQEGEAEVPVHGADEQHPEGAQERTASRDGGEKGGGGQQAIHAHEVGSRPADGVHPRKQHAQFEAGKWRCKKKALHRFVSSGGGKRHSSPILWCCA